MFKDLRPYPDYRSSDLGWVARLPSSWGSTKLKRLVAIQGGATPARTKLDYWNGHVPWVTPKLMKSSEITRSTQHVSDVAVAETPLTLIDPPAVLLVVRGMILARRVPVAVSRVPVTINQDMKALLPRPGIDADYLAQVLCAAEPTLLALGSEAGHGTRKLDTEVWAELRLPVAGTDEQAAIVKYLTHAHARIDRAIAAKRRLGLLIDEQRQAMTRRLLTCTSDGDPANWQYVPAGHLCKITTGVEDSGNAVPDGEYPFYVRGREILRASDYIMDAEAVMTPGDGQGGVGKVFHYFNGKFQAHQRVYIFSDFDGVDGRFFYWHLSSFFRRFALSQSNTVTMESLRLPVLASFPVAVPSLSEQRKIVSRIEAEDARAHAVRLTVQREIELLREFRMRLTSDVVTGQLDVRHIAATLPDLDPGKTADDVGPAEDDLVDEAAELLEAVDT